MPKQGLKKGKFTEQEVLRLALAAYQSNPTFQIKDKKAALLVIDMQDEFVRPGWTPHWVPEATRQVPKIMRLIEFCRKKKIPVIFTSFANTNNYLDRPKIGGFMPNRYPNLATDRSSFFRDGTIWHELGPKKKRSCTSQTVLRRFLRHAA